MVALKTLKYLSNQKKKDAVALLQKDRNSAAIYLMGYALEFELKRKVSLTLGFNNGFPEYSVDFAHYSAQVGAFNAISSGIQLTQLKQIRNHNLNELLKYSGAQGRITASYYDHWLIVKDWNPEDRYKIRKYSRDKAQKIINSFSIILKQIV
jgi:hypothetical protein